MRLINLFAVFVTVSLAGSVPVPAKQRGDTLVIVAGVAARNVAADVVRVAGQQGHKVIDLPAGTVSLASQLKADIEQGQIFEEESGAPAHLAAFSSEVLKAIPDLSEYPNILVVSDQIFPLEMVRVEKGFVGDVTRISHVFPVSGVSRLDGRRGNLLPMLNYAVDAVIGMPTDLSRVDQDIVKVALKLEREIPVEFKFGGDADTLVHQLTRKDISILHIDTHGGPGGQSIQVSRAGAMLKTDDAPVAVATPLVLLFGCEGVGSRQSFGSVLHARGAQAVISSFAKFNSFGLTGDPAREHQIYEAFFSALKAGQDVGAALVKLRQAALLEARASSQRATITRLLFVLVGRDDITFAWPAATIK